MKLVTIPVNDFAHVDIFHGVLDEALNTSIVTLLGRWFLRSKSLVTANCGKWDNPNRRCEEDDAHPLFIPVEESTKPQFDFERHGAKRITKGTLR